MICCGEVDMATRQASLATRARTARRKGVTGITFKISPHLPSIIELVEKNRFSAVSAQTGSGKTLCIPPGLAERGHRVRVALPTVVATISAADFQREHTHFKVGYAANRDIQYHEDTEIVYATTGHFTNKLLSILKEKKEQLTAEDINFLGDVFVIDEVHTGTTDISLLIGLLRYIIDSYDWEFHPRLVFTSATLNQLDVERYFPVVPTHSVELERLPITHIYAERETDLLKENPIQQVYSIVDKELKLMSREKKNSWHGIIFRPGVNEVEEMVSALDKRYGEQLMVLPAYSELSREDLQAIFEEHGCPKIVVGTNIIESSVTIDGVGFIIDDGLIKRVFTGDTGGTRLTTCVVSQDAATQRAGRTARTMPGRAYKLYTQRYHDMQMTRHHPLEIDRVPIFNVVLRIIDAELEPTGLLRISGARYAQARKTLESTGMITYEGKECKLKVTDAGDFVSKVNLGIYNAFLIYTAIQKYRQNEDEYTLRSAVALAIMLETYGPPPFYVPRPHKGEDRRTYDARKMAHIDKYFTRFKEATEIETLVHLFWTMNDEVYDLQCGYHTQRRGERPFMAYVKQWCVDNSMNFKKIKEFYNIFRPVLRSVSRYLKVKELAGDIDGPEETDMPVIYGNIMRLFREAYAENTFTQMAGNKYSKDSESGWMTNVYKLGNTQYSTQLGFSSKIIAAQVIEIQSHYGINRLVGLYVPVPEEASAAPKPLAES